MADTRKDKRAPVSLKVRFKSATVDEFIEHYSRDVSRGGIFIKSSQPMSVGTLLKFQFQLKDESALIRGVGRVVWTRAEVDATAALPAGMGIKFIKMDDESRAMVERILDTQDDGPGSFERGQLDATEAESASAPPPASVTSAPPPSAPAERVISLAPSEPAPFFPESAEGDLLPEDRTEVRQAAQLIAAVLSEGGTDEAATREAQQQAEQARRRSEEIEAERRQAEEGRKSREPGLAIPETPLPTMIVDPSLDPREGRPSEINLDELSDQPVGARGLLAGEDVSADADTEPPSGSDSVHPPLELSTRRAQMMATGSTPAVPTKRNYLPIAVILLLLLVAGVVALRGGPRELVEEPPRAVNPPTPATIAPAPEPAPEPSRPSEQPAVVADEPDASELALSPDAGEPSAPSESETDAGSAPPVAEAEPSAADEDEAAAIVEQPVVTVPKGAEVYVDGSLRGQAPLQVQLREGVAAVISARAPGHSELSAEVTPKKRNPPLRLKLKILPYVVHVESTPAGATFNVGGVRGTAPSELRLDKIPDQPLSVTARLHGYQNARTRLAPEAFAEQEGAMRAMLSLTLEPEGPPSAPAPELTPSAPEPAAAPAPGRERRRRAARLRERAREAEEAAAPGDSAPAPEPAAPEAVPAPEAPSPAPEGPAIPLAPVDGAPQ